MHNPNIVNFLAGLYCNGESTYTIEDNDKMTTVTVDRAKYKLSKEAEYTFECIHNDWEINIWKKYPYEPLIGGNITFTLI